ncbi:hypothetical protein Kpol_304p4 [Vanderwaltozyma polyspora DSM 70294]|uniref:Suppressor of lethality of KEX2 GAS1 double null mutant protein 1 n=1 Tax=Vanderwaltozyma polyspora (strain ATCC 22028 / DSM 70294 / BCRC 21397 / CBS 2163 / NBRC 10782 / NRRL Y-8283 / UCD 57-17) TaxID=436907 RepID=SKG1_VANPO|nr:uncharacterized protein Kpol_304p4 [Vanderwaltozyma polyspora DSM 70294]A7TSZ6.1 RecName: Full=Suppressor of lethality of KEX2 GAS1 double null mutant protein 1 [Vanderwaltozyma polyspora DSM 70294]EDO14612.1 hypothetical protein Kpol_304p4 [Vanderwaltozyma polyspora DSM 70294]
MVASNSVAVGCAVGIPVGVGLIIAGCFWLRLQRRFKREDEQDADLQRAVFDEDAYINFESMPTLRNNNNNDEDNNDDKRIKKIEENGNENTIPINDNKEQRKSKYFVPAYRRKINALSVRYDGQQNIEMQGFGANSSKVSLDSSNAPPKRVISVYDQMVPFVDGDKNSVIQNTELLESNDSVGNDSTRPSSQANLISNLNSNDFGSYYPRKESFSSINIPHLNTSSPSFTTRPSSVNSMIRPNSTDNIFDTPRKSNSDIVSINKDQVNRTGSPVKGTVISENMGYKLKNNYNIENSNEIAEEDQYENEFTNYSQNKKEFIDSLRPK